jgi:tryptophan 2,3-dioxygenase
MVTILQVLVHQIDIMETMTPMDFLDFRERIGSHLDWSLVKAIVKFAGNRRDHAG